MNEEEELLNPEAGNRSANGVSRRDVLGVSAAACVSLTAGCISSLPGTGQEAEPATVFVFNEDQTVSFIDVETDEVLQTTYLGTTDSLPANQYSIQVTGQNYPILWLSSDRGVTAVDGSSLEIRSRTETSYSPNYPNLTPDGQYLMVASGGTSTRVPKPEHPTHTISRIDADPESSSFGEKLETLDYGKRGPCDMTVGPNGDYVYVPDVYEETFSVISVDPLEVVGRLELSPLVGDRTLPFMATAAWDGSLVAVEVPEGQPGQREGRQSTERFIDVSDPEEPEEVAALTEDDGLGAYPLTSEISGDNEFAYIFTLDSQDVTVVNLDSFTVENRLDLGGPAIGGTWGPSLTKLYVPVLSNDTVKVINHGEREITGTISVKQGQKGVTAGRIRPDDAS